MNAEKIIQELNSTVIDIHKVVKQLIQTNEVLEAENEELMRTIVRYENQLYNIQKVIDQDVFESNNENKNL